jgi:putative oxidoreductase
LDTYLASIQALLRSDDSGHSGITIEAGEKLMNSRKFALTVVFIGIAALIASHAWWAGYFNLVIRQLGANPSLTSPLGCLLFTSDLCAQAKATAKVTDLPEYLPLAMWAAIVILLIGIVLVARSSATSPYPVTPVGEPRLLIGKLEPFYAWSRDLSWPIVRMVAGLTLFTSGYVKLTTGVIATFATGSMARRGLEPAVPLAYIVFFNEGIGSIMVALGLFTRFVAASIAIEMYILTFLAVFANGFAYTNPRGGWEVPLMWGCLFFAIALRGGGPYSLDRLLGREL